MDDGFISRSLYCTAYGKKKYKQIICTEITDKEYEGDDILYYANTSPHEISILKGPVGEFDLNFPRLSTYISDKRDIPSVISLHGGRAGFIRLTTFELFFDDVFLRGGRRA